jgi:hypothetical protein
MEEKNKHPKYYLMNTASVLCRVLCIGKTNSEVAVHKGSSRKDKEEKKVAMNGTFQAEASTRGKAGRSDRTTGVWLTVTTNHPCCFEIWKYMEGSGKGICLLLVIPNLGKALLQNLQLILNFQP